ncbi:MULTISPECIES: hypothetical protein [Photorhabdus]|nr:hypothetical protein [Photorhabdus asymbiotica]
MTGVSECSQQRGNLKDNRYIPYGRGILWIHITLHCLRQCHLALRC